MSVWAASLCSQDSGIWVPLTFSLLHSRFCCRGQWPFIAWNQESPWHWECPGLVSWPMFLIGPQFLHLKPKKGFPGGSVVKNHLLRQETWIRSLGQEDPLEKEMATCSTILAWEIPWTGELQSWSLTELNTTKQLNTTDWKTNQIKSLLSRPKRHRKGSLATWKTPRQFPLSSWPSPKNIALSLTNTKKAFNFHLPPSPSYDKVP